MLSWVDYKDKTKRYLNTNKIHSFLSKNAIVIACLTLLCTILLIRHNGQLPSEQSADRSNGTRTKLLLANPYGMRGGSRSAIATLSTSSLSDIRDLCFALQSLRNLRGGDTAMPNKSPVLVFNEGDLRAEQMDIVQQCTDRPVLFPIVSLNGHYPLGFDPDKEWEIATRFGVHANRDRWSYSQMIRFWTTNMWKHPAVQQFDTIMRIDTDSCFLEQIGKLDNQGYYDLPHLSSRYVYQSNYNGDVGNPKYPEYIAGLYDFTVGYMAKNHIEPGNPELWTVIKKTWEEGQNLPVFQTNFEITRKSFFQREDVARWHESLTEVEPFGVWRHRWGDAQTRVLTAAIFGTRDSILLTRSHGYKHGRGRCQALLKGAQLLPQLESLIKREKTKEHQSQESQEPKEQQQQPQQQQQQQQPQQPQLPSEVTTGLVTTGLVTTKEVEIVAGPPRTNTGPWPKGIVWLMTFPNSGTMFTTDLVTRATGTATGTNYGNELRKRNFDYMTAPDFAYTTDGPFRYSTHPMPDGFLLTKTHCAGYCTECPPKDYLIDPVKFANQCATGVKDKPGGGNMGIRYGFDVVKKAVHMFRDPFDNCVALFHNQYKVHKRQGSETWNYSYDRSGFREWCRYMDSAFLEDEERDWAPEIITMAKDVPCHTAYYQYVQWHNNALKATAELGIPTMDLYYEDFHYDMGGQVTKLLDFLELQFIGSTIPFKWKGYDEYFTDEERMKISSFMRLMGSPELTERLKRYTEKKKSSAASSTTGTF